MALQEKVYMSGGEVRVVTMLDRLTSEYWMLENAGKLSPLPQEQSESAEPAKKRWLSFEGSAASANEALGLPMGVTEQELVAEYVRRAQALRSQAFYEMMSALVNGLSRGLKKVRGWLGTFEVHPDDLARPPFSR